MAALSPAGISNTLTVKLPDKIYQNFYTISKCYWLQYAYVNSSARPYNCTSFWFLVFGFNRVWLAGC